MDHVILSAFFIAGLAAAILTPICMTLARHFNVLDRPGGLKTHKTPIPYLGGLAVYAGFLIGVLGIVTWFEQSIGGMQDVLIGAGLIFLLGLIDDIKPLSIPFKFLWQGLVALGVAVIGDVSIHIFPWEWANIMLSVFWVVGMTNAMNIIDIMDGLAGGVTVLASATMTLLALQEGMGEVALLSAGLCGATMGVLVFNRPPAKIYYGDAGALLMGFLLAALAMASRYTTHHVSGFAAPLLILAVPLFDTFFVMWQRSRNGKSMFFGSPDHFALRLERKGWSRPAVAGMILTGNFILCSFVVFSNPWSTVFAGIGYAAVGLVTLSFAWWLHYHAP